LPETASRDDWPEVAVADETLDGRRPLVVRGPAALLVVAGRSRATAATSRRLALEAGDFVLVPAGRGASIEAEDSCRLLVLRFDGAAIETWAGRLPEAGLLEPLALVCREAGGPAARAARRAEAEAREVEALLAAAAGASRPPRRAGDASLAALARGELLILAARLAARAEALPSGEAPPASGGLGSAPSRETRVEGPWSVEDAVRYVEEHYAESFSLDFFVSRCALNTSDFSRRFKERAGCPLFEYLNRQRVRRACALLKGGDLPVIEIALAVGYNNLSFFNRYFLRIMRMTPREYRASSRR